ncbi:flagellar motor switch protein FliM [Pseudoroseicyclus aestuarii]|uniref:Flagellar motor switch protein FliM n=1 Tax=Pseudoroseicyclus aestuarii TaxID=1795041 RepID=A0A318T7Y6_9RHOB|nr:FliM/FliN family flagellar motor switch protein [Pseudoroseicyclus aestuarii]PYE84508.1 flagellar motor switch protein FliM [Pseudoroseicyclus aestuarii]
MNTQTTAPAGEPVEELIIRTAAQSFEPLPMLEVATDRYTLALSSALKNFVGVPVEVTLQQARYMTCGDAMATLPAPGFIAVTEAEGWDGPMLTAISPQLLFAMLEFMLGGNPPAGKAREWVPRRFTAIERRFGMRLCAVILAELTRAFSQIAPVEFSIGQVESNPQAAALAPGGGPSVLLRIDVRIDGHGGPLHFMIPYGAIDTIRPLLAQPFLGGSLSGESGWRQEMEGRLGETSVQLQALLCRVRLPMAEVLNWRAGQVLDLGVLTDHEAMLTCGGRQMFTGAMGRKSNGSVALRLTGDMDGTETSRKDGADGTAD